MVVPAPDEEGVCFDGFETDFVCQQSWNPLFATDFDITAETTYNLRLVLTRETFKGLPLAVRIQVNVVNPS